MQNLEQTILSQYANSNVLLALIEAMNESVDPGRDIDDFYDLIWNIETAQGYGLDVWGRIVGISRILSIPVVTDNWGFAQGVPSSQPFDQAPFYAGTVDSANYIMSDAAYRAIILIKALSNISNCSMQTQNKILMQMFPGRGNAYVQDLGNMVSQLTFEFPLSVVEISLLTHGGAFFNPTGVQQNILIISVHSHFGFAEAPGSSNSFGHGTF